MRSKSTERTILEFIERFVERGSDQLGEGSVVLVVQLLHRVVDAFVVEPGMLITNPGIHGEASGIQIQPADALAEREVRRARVGAQLDENIGSCCLDDPPGEWYVLVPRRQLAGEARWPQRCCAQRRFEQGV
jgi:hypothetical protein